MAQSMCSIKLFDVTLSKTSVWAVRMTAHTPLVSTFLNRHKSCFNVLMLFSHNCNMNKAISPFGKRFTCQMLQRLGSDYTIVLINRIVHCHVYTYCTSKFMAELKGYVN